MRESSFPVASEAHTRASLEVEFTRAVTTPGLSPLVEREREALFPRFARYYEKLTRLPRRTRRALQRQWRRSLGPLALLLALGQAPALAAVLPVTTTNPNINPNGLCSLIEAIDNANADAQTHADCPAGSGPDTLTLQNSSGHTLTRVNNSTYHPTGLPVVSSLITIEGNGSTIRRDPEDPAHFRIFAVNSAGDLTVSDTTVSGGKVAEGSYNVGGGIANFGGTLTLTNSTVSGNSTAYDRGGSGGGISNSGTLTLTNSTVSHNVATSYYNSGGLGGGITSGGTLTLTNSIVSDNSADDAAYDAGRGGDIVIAGTATLTNSTVSGNNASLGGGVRNYGTLTLTNSTVSGNSARCCGAGVYNREGSLTLRNSTVSGNSAYNGGGVFNSAGTVTLTNSTVSGNSAEDYGGGVYNNVYGTLTVRRTLVSGNTAATGAEVYNGDGTLTADNFNLFGHSGLIKRQAFFGFTPGASDITATSGGTNPTALANILDTMLADNGGSTETHALVAGSSAIDAVGSGCPPPKTDQRRVARPQGAACDIGAFEARPCESAIATLGCTVNGVPEQSCTGTAGDDTILGSRGADVIRGLGGDDAIEGDSGSDLLCGGRGNDLLSGGRGADQLHGQGGDDTLEGRAGADALNGGAGTDTCVSDQDDTSVVSCE